jgi:hypothetical protein
MLMARSETPSLGNCPMRVPHITRSAARMDGYLHARIRNIFRSGNALAYAVDQGEIPLASRAIAIPKKNRSEALPLEEQIRQRAFEIYSQRGGTGWIGFGRLAASGSRTPSRRQRSVDVVGETKSGGDGGHQYGCYRPSARDSSTRLSSAATLSQTLANVSIGAIGDYTPLCLGGGPFSVKSL